MSFFTLLSCAKNCNCHQSKANLCKIGDVTLIPEIYDQKPNFVNNEFTLLLHKPVTSNAVNIANDINLLFGGFNDDTTKLAIVINPCKIKVKIPKVYQEDDRAFEFIAEIQKMLIPDFKE